MDLMKLVDSERALQRWAWASLICNMGIVVTGGIVRITGSGLGCDTWPQCQPGSFTPHGESGVHEYIEFGNRLLTFVLCAVALGAFVAAHRVRGARSKLWWLNLWIGIGIIAQAVIGGITVLLDLHPYAVNLHLAVSIALIVIATWALLLAYRRVPTLVERRHRGLTVATFCVAMLSVVTGALTTGAGPHAGDEHAIRNGLDIESIARVHAISAWLVVIFATICIIAFQRAKLSHPARVALCFLGAVLLQGVIGYIQYFLGIPAGVVWLHMAGLTVLTAAAAWLLLSVRSAGDVEA